MIKIKQTMVEKMRMVQHYSDAYVLVIGDITATSGNENTKVAFKN